MKTGKIFWGVLFLTLGLLILINNITTICLDWSVVWNLWPVILIVIGAFFFMKESKYRWILVALISLILALVIFSTYKNITDFFHEGYDYDDSVETDLYQEPFNDSVKKANLYVEAGVGYLRLKDTTSQLYDVKTKGSFGNYLIDHNITDGSADIYLEYQDKHFRFNRGFTKNSIDIRLNPKPIWTMEYEIGVEKVDLDLREYNVESLTFKTGVSSVRVKLGDKNDKTKLRFEGGVSKLIVLIPRAVGCEIMASTELTKKNFKGFDKIDKQNYKTENFETAPKKVLLDLRADVSNITVERY
ncbi:MAG: hypothetical protein C4539_14795 [Ignavibacteriales bacterium]|nr:MAG: hypothetical protein C4539_14795 [Ignavibacteriales bacterium]